MKCLYGNHKCCNCTDGLCQEELNAPRPTRSQAQRKSRFDKDMI